MAQLEELGRVRLSPHFFMREMLYSEIANFHGLPNIPDDPELAIAAGRQLCEQILEPLRECFGHVSIRSAFRSVTVNEYGAVRREQKYGCGPTQWNYARHIWDRRDAHGHMGATASIVIPWFLDRYETGTPWQALAWWIHDHLPYSDMLFYERLSAFNVRWFEKPARKIDFYDGKQSLCLTQPGMDNHDGNHAQHYPGFPSL